MAQGGSAEVALGELAQTHAASPEVKTFGQRMIRDYRRLSQEIGTIMRRHGLTPPTEPSEPERAAVAALAAETGPAFDQAYLAQQARAHAMTLSQFQRTAEGPDASAVRSFARREMDTVRGHLDDAQSLLRRVQAAS
jgi:putative membrane protein